MTAVGHYVFGGIRPQSPGQRITPAANVHLSVLLALLIGLRAWGFWLDRYLLSYSERGIVTGLSYTDVNAQLRGYQLLTVIAAVCALLFLANIRVRGWILPSAGRRDPRGRGGDPRGHLPGDHPALPGRPRRSSSASASSSTATWR